MFVDTYKNATQGLKKLQVEQYAFSTDNEEHVNARLRNIHENCKISETQDTVKSMLTSCQINLDEDAKLDKELSDEDWVGTSRTVVPQRRDNSGNVIFVIFLNRLLCGFKFYLWHKL